MEIPEKDDVFIGVEMLEAKATLEPSMFDLTYELALVIQDADVAESIFDTIKTSTFVKSINYETLKLNSVRISEVTIIYPSELGNNMDTSVERRENIQVDAAAYMKQMQDGDPSNATLIEDPTKVCNK